MSFDPARLERLLEPHRECAGGLLPALHDVQAAFGCVPGEAVEPIAAAFNLSRAEVHGVVSYYHHFRATPPGRHTVRVCQAEACRAMGAVALLAHAERRLACRAGETSADGAVTLEAVYCLGLCASSPALLVDDDAAAQPHARMTPQRLDALLTTLTMPAGSSPGSARSPA
ncbi:MAG: NAD(P)H-dependent oxidoreductase subunit E [Lautropia sp.]